MRRRRGRRARRGARRGSACREPAPPPRNRPPPSPDAPAGRGSTRPGLREDRSWRGLRRSNRARLAEFPLFCKCSCTVAHNRVLLPIRGRGPRMVQRVSTVAFEGIEARAVDVQVQVAPGLPAFHVVGLADKAVSEARERVRAALTASGLALPARRITVNLAPADLPKEGSHYDLPIALGLMAAIGAIPQDALNGFTVLGELGLDGSIA